MLIKLVIFSALAAGLDCAKIANTRELSETDFANGEILLANDTKDATKHDYSKQDILRQGDVHNANKKGRWDRGVIPYEISSLYNTNERAVVAGAIREYQTKTCVKLVQRKSERDYIHITPDDGQGDKVSTYCYSYVGKQGGKQFVKMYGECVRLAAMIHELGHAIGFEHEHNRADRDNYINILWDNISRTYHYAYQKVNSRDYDTLGLPYDYKSIMHYPDTAFAQKGKAFTLKFPGDLSRENQRLSDNDIAKIKKFYSC